MRSTRPTAPSERRRTARYRELAFAAGFVQRAEFPGAYDAGLNDEAFVDALIASVGAANGAVDLSNERANLLLAYSSGRPHLRVAQP